MALSCETVAMSSLRVQCVSSQSNERSRQFLVFFIFLLLTIHTLYIQSNFPSTFYFYYDKLHQARYKERLKGRQVEKQNQKPENKRIKNKKKEFDLISSFFSSVTAQNKQINQINSAQICICRQA